MAFCQWEAHAWGRQRPGRRTIANRFPPSSRLAIKRTALGVEGEPLIGIDSILAEPRALVDAAAAARFAPAWGKQGGYPGVRAPAPLDYVEGLSRALLPVLIDAFALPPARLARAECTFSMVTLPPEALVPAQREPHADTDDPWQFAILHYLCDARFGGTAFYRHRKTGFETLRPERAAAYAAARRAEGHGEGGYIAGDTDAFERIGAVTAAFDRLIVYRSRLLHSGLIPTPGLLNADPRRGRLTANIFLTLRPDG